MNKKVWSTYVPEPVPSWIWVIFMLLYSRCCMWFLCMSAQLSTRFVMRSVYCLKILQFYLNILTVFFYSLLQHHCVTAQG